MSNRLSRWLPTSLTSRLVLTAVALVAVVGLLVGTVTIVAMRSYLTDQLDADLSRSVDRAAVPVEDRDDFPGPRDGEGEGEGDRDRDGESESEPDLDVRGQAEGTLTALFPSSGAVGDVITSSGDRQALSTPTLARLAEVPIDGEIHTVRLADVGDYRVQAVGHGGTRVLVGLPTASIDDALGSLVAYELLLTLGGVILAAVSGHWLVRRQLRPLREVAGTAHEVAELPLSSGAIGTTVRVPAELTDPRTEVGQVGSALNTLLVHVEHALDARHRSELQVRQFVADASHELRTPLTTIQGYAELSRRTSGGQPDPARLSLAMDKVESEATRMSALVEDLLLLARLDSGRPLARDEVDLTRLALEAVADARVVDPDRHWALDLPEEPVTTTGDDQRLHQVLSNLLTNARRHTPEGTRVTVGLRRDHGAVLTVHDDGPGLPADLADRAFERFTRGDNARTRTSGGAGLGLSLVEAITIAHGGTVTVASRPGHTTFTVRLP